MKHGCNAEFDPDTPSSVFKASLFYTHPVITALPVTAISASDLMVNIVSFSKICCPPPFELRDARFFWNLIHTLLEGGQR